MVFPPKKSTELLDADGDAYQSIVGHINEICRGKISDSEAHEATRNLIGFCQLLLEIESQRL